MIVPTFFAKLIFFPPQFFLVFWKREIFLSKKNFGGKKLNLAKKFFNLAKTILPYMIYHVLHIRKGVSALSILFYFYFLSKLPSMGKIDFLQILMTNKLLLP
jgi:hypothetical protein